MLSMLSNALFIVTENIAQAQNGLCHTFHDGKRVTTRVGL
jgi:hypothetical protein